MFVIDVITLAKNAPIGTLSYRTKDKLKPGNLVEVPLRKKTVLGIVANVTSVRDARTTLRTASYTLRSGSAKKVGTIPPSLMEAAEEIAAYHATTLGPVLSALLPEVLPENGFGEYASGSGFKEEYSEQPKKGRIAPYLQRAARAKREKTTLLILVPTVAEAEAMADECRSHGFGTVLLTGSLTGKKRRSALAAAAASPDVVVATPSFLFVPLKRPGAIIVERESAGSYVTQKRPYIDLRVAARALARAHEVPLILGDYPLRIERRQVPTAPLSGAETANVSILDVRREKEEQKTAFTAIPQEIVDDLRKIVAANGRAIVLAVRKGYAPAVVCRDCGTTVKDERGRTLALVGTAAGKPVLRSPDGSTLRDAKALCDICGSWNLMPLGVGVERVALELAKALPGAAVIRFDSETVKTPAQARKAIEAAKEPGSILVSTESVLAWLRSDEAFDYAAIASADSLLALPFWRSRERLVHLGLSLAALSKRLVIATRRPDDSAFAAILHPSSADFFEEETGMRSALKYPPYSTLITISYEGTRERVAAIAARMNDLLSAYAPTALPAHLGSKGRYRGTSILKLAKDAWPNEALSMQLAALGPSVRVLVDPESLW